MRKYEYLYIIEPQEEVWEKSIEKIKEHYTQLGVNLIKEDKMGKRSLAYPINKKTDGFYYVTNIEVDDFTSLQAYENELKLDPDILRFIKIRK